jgi:hypothetical protein
VIKNARGYWEPEPEPPPIPCRYCEAPIPRTPGRNQRLVCPSLECQRIWKRDRMTRVRNRRRERVEKAAKQGVLLCTECGQRPVQRKRQGRGYYKRCSQCRNQKAVQTAKASARRREQREIEECAVREADLRVAAVVRERTADVVGRVMRRPADDVDGDGPEVLEL